MIQSAIENRPAGGIFMNGSNDLHSSLGKSPAPEFPESLGLRLASDSVLPYMVEQEGLGLEFVPTQVSSLGLGHFWSHFI